MILAIFELVRYFYIDNNAEDRYQSLIKIACNNHYQTSAELEEKKS